MHRAVNGRQMTENIEIKCSMLKEIILRVALRLRVFVAQRKNLSVSPCRSHSVVQNILRQISKMPFHLFKIPDATYKNDDGTCTTNRN